MSDYTALTAYKLTNAGVNVGPLLQNYFNVVVVDGTDVGINLGSQIFLQLNQSTLAFDSAVGMRGLGYMSTSFAADGGGKIWGLDLAGLEEIETNPNGVPAYTGGGLNTAAGPHQPMPFLAIDGAKNVWVANYSAVTGTLSEFSNNGTALSPGTGLYGSGNVCRGQGLAIDGSGNVWVGCDSAVVPVMEYIGAAVPVYTPTLPGHFGTAP